MKIVSPTNQETRLDTNHTKGVTTYNYTDSKISYVPCENEFVDTYKGSNVVPDDVKYIVSHIGRLFVSGSVTDNDNVFITDMQNPFYFPVSLPIQLPPNSDKVRGMNVFDDSVIIGREEDIYCITGKTNRLNIGMDVFELKKLNTHTGFANHKAVDSVNNYMFFLGSDGVCYALAGITYNQKALSTAIISKQIDIYKAPINLSKDDILMASSIYYDGNWYLTIKDKVLIYNYDKRGWTMYNNMNATSYYIINNELIWGNKDGRTIKIADDYLDFTYPYQAYWYSKYFDMDEPITFKQFREFFLVAHTFENYKSDINVIFEIDYSDVSEDFVISNQMSIWGKAIWGDRFINRNIVASLPLVLGMRGRNLRFKFSNGYYIREEVETVDDLTTLLAKSEGLLIKVIADGDFLSLY